MNPPPLIRLPQCGSTQDEVHRLGVAGAAHGTAVVAGEQMAGRGSRGRTWHSPVGGLWLSLLWRPEGARGIELLSLRTGLALAALFEGIERLPSLQLKWPNDLMLGEAKVGGVLCEARWSGETADWVAVGVGLNVQNVPPMGTRVAAASLSSWRPDLDPAELAVAVQAALARLPALPALLPDELAAWDERDWLKGRHIAAPHSGIATGISAQGALLVKTADGKVRSAVSGMVELAESG